VAAVSDDCSLGARFTYGCCKHKTSVLLPEVEFPVGYREIKLLP
jgi:hypothetical protein